MRRSTVLASLATLAIGIAAGAGLAQQQPQGPTPFFVGNRLGPDQSGRRRRVPADLAERQGLRLHPLGRELLV